MDTNATQHLGHICFPPASPHPQIPGGGGDPPNPHFRRFVSHEILEDLAKQTRKSKKLWVLIYLPFASKGALKGFI